MVEFPAVTVCNHNKLKRSTLTGTVYDEIKKIDAKYKALIKPEEFTYDYVDTGVYTPPAAGEYCIYCH